MSNTDSFNLVVNSGAPEGFSISAPHVTPVMLLKVISAVNSGAPKRYSIPAPQVTPVTLLKIMTKSMQEIEVNGQEETTTLHTGP